MDEGAGAGDGRVLGRVQSRREHGEQRRGLLGADEAGELLDPETVRLVQWLAQSYRSATECSHITYCSSMTT